MVIGHWDEKVCMDNELMTGYRNGGQVNPISAATLDDLGYSVDYSSSTIDNT